MSGSHFSLQKSEDTLTKKDLRQMSEGSGCTLSDPRVEQRLDGTLESVVVINSFGLTRVRGRSGQISVQLRRVG